MTRRLSAATLSVFLLSLVLLSTILVNANPVLNKRAPPVKQTTAPKLPTSTVPPAPVTTTVTRLPIASVSQKFPGWAPRALGDAVNGANFPRDDPDGTKRLKRAKDERVKWHNQKPGQGPVKMKRATTETAWDLSKVGGINYVTSIKDQGSCGSCVSFATTAALESTILYAMKTPASASLSSTPDLSEHWLYYCAGARTCNAGWWIDTGVITAAKAGDLDEVCMPYSTSTTRCYTLQAGCNSITSNINKTMGSLEAVPLNDWDAIRSHIVNFGPISTGFSVYSDFPGFQDSTVYQFNSDYVWSGTKTNVLLGGHAIMCYGFDDNMLNGVTSTSVGVLFCKNSWGTSWGNQGFFKIAYGADGVMGGYGDSYGFKFTPFPRTTTVVPVAQTTTTVAPPPPVVPTTAMPPPPPVTTAPPPPPPATTKTPTTTDTTRTKPPVTTKPPVVKTTKIPVKPVRKLEQYVCSNNGGQIPKLKFGCQSFPDTFLNVTYFKYGRDVAGVKGTPSTCPKDSNSKLDTAWLCGTQPMATAGQCNGYKSCSVQVDDATLGKSGCYANVLKLARVRFDCLPVEAFGVGLAKAGEKVIGKR